MKVLDEGQQLRKRKEELHQLWLFQNQLQKEKENEKHRLKSKWFFKSRHEGTIRYLDYVIKEIGKTMTAISDYMDTITTRIDALDEK